MIGRHAPAPNTALTRDWVPPAPPLDDLLSKMGSKLWPLDRPIAQYVSWAEKVGLFACMEQYGVVGLREVCDSTPLNEKGADALLGVLCALGLAEAEAGVRYRLSPTARAYLLRSSPFFIGGHLYAPKGKLPSIYTRSAPKLLARTHHRLLYAMPHMRYGNRSRLWNQHVRNLPACCAAVATGEFRDVRCLVDVAGGSGTFSIPLALKYPSMRVVLAELPVALKNIRPFLHQNGVQDRVGLLGLDAFQMPWRLPDCDGIFIGNFLHGCSDSSGVRMLRECHRSLSQGGKVWIHEMIWNDNKDGPLITALWNFALQSSPGRKRTGKELMDLISQAGFVEPSVVPTSAPFALVAGRKS